MKRRLQGLLLSFVVIILASCGRPIPIEDMTIALILGVDLDENNNLVVSISSPVFSEEASKSVETIEVPAKTIRQSRELFNAMSTGEVSAAKIQVFLIGKRVVEQDNWFSILDTVYRNPAFSINTRVLVVDGAVSDVIKTEPPDKPQLPLHLKQLVDKYTLRTTDVLITFEEIHRQMFEKGITPFIPELKQEKELKLAGTSLLDGKGKYVDTLDLPQSVLLLTLRDDQKHQLTFTFPTTSLNDDEGGIFNLNEMSIDFNDVNTKVKTNYVEGKFQFDFNINMKGSIIERLFVTTKNEEELKKLIEEELKTRFEELIKKLQENKIDPIGLGLYARAYHYKQYKEVEDNWGEAFAEATINVTVDVRLKSSGAVK